MTTCTRKTLGAVALFALAACGDSPQPVPAADTHTDKPVAAEAPASPNEVKVDDGMLRDLRITTATVESRSGADRAVLLGELSVDERTYSEVGAPLPARVVRLLAGPGDQVRQHQPVVELQAVEVGRARAEYLSATARLTLAEQALTRKRGLAAERIAPQREVEEAEADAAAARAAQSSDASALASLGLSIPSTTEVDRGAASTFVLQTPVGGVVIDRQARLGQMLDPAVPAFRIADLSTLWLTVHAFERDAVRITHGTQAQVTFSALPGEVFTGRVALVGRQVSTESRTVDVRIDVVNRRGVLRPGMSASAVLPIGGDNTPVIVVPVAAVQRVADAWCVFLPKGTGIFEIRTIGRGRDLGGEVEVLSGLTIGESVVVDGAFLLKSQAEKRSAGHGH